ncbi:hypothetical protein LTR41_011351 [Exophiala xenobiotica]|nr:hypothetical protein LTR41_011351 [Exophiala xenobiotica]KAK5550815.1 hypothetical protein LTR46_011173 [Exophiala xenobiotica]
MSITPRRQQPLTRLIRPRIRLRLTLHTYLPRRWDGVGVVEAIKLIQRGESTYAEFSQLCVDAGVTGYLAYLTGKRVVYYGSQGEMHVEWFAGAGPTGK